MTVRNVVPEAGPNLAGETALVTGGTRGIGLAVARGLAAAGARVAIAGTSRSSTAAAALASLSGHSPDGRHLLLAADLADAEAARRLVDETVDAFGQLDILINNAGIYEDHPPLGVDWDTWRTAWERTLAINLAAPAHLAYWAGRHMAARGGGRIVDVSSRGAFRGEPDAPAYGASKGGLNSLGGSLARALAPHGVLVYTVAPGWVETDMAMSLAGPGGDAIRAQSPFHRVATPEEIAQVVVFLAASRNASMSGAIIDVNGASYLRS